MLEIVSSLCLVLLFCLCAIGVYTNRETHLLLFGKPLRREDEDFEIFVGRRVDQETLREIQRYYGPDSVIKLQRKGWPVTLDYGPNRIRVYHDTKGIITGASRG